MTDEEIAALYARAFANDRRLWQAQAIASFRRGRHNTIHTAPPDAVLMVTEIGDEAEIVSLFVDPYVQGRGRGRALLMRWHDSLGATPVRRIFLEVARDNHAARALYQSLGYEKFAERKAYYQRKSGPAVDAILYAKRL